jgi:hypothetical protein
MNHKCWLRGLSFMSLVLISNTAAHGDAGNGKIFMVYDRGQDSCGQVIEARRFNQQESIVYEIWLAGYVTAYNHLKPDTSDLLNLPIPTKAPAPMASPMLWIEKYCTEHPMESFFVAVDHFTDAMYPNRRR